MKRLGQVAPPEYVGAFCLPFRRAGDAPLRMMTCLGFLLALGTFVGGAIYLVRTLISGAVVQGFPTLFPTILLLAGTQLIALGVLGEYLGHVFNETKRRPLFLTASVIWSGPATTRQPPVRNTIDPR